MRFLEKKKKSIFYYFKKRSKLNKFYDDNEEFILYCLVSVICTLVLFIVFYLVNLLTKGNYMLANFISYVSSFTLLYVLDERVFKSRPSKKKHRYRQMIIFIVIRTIGFPIDSYVLYLLINKCHIRHLLAKVVGSLIMFVYNYICNKLFVFNMKE